MNTRRTRLVVIGALGAGLALSQAACAQVGNSPVAAPAPSATSAPSPSAESSSPGEAADSSGEAGDSPGETGDSPGETGDSPGETGDSPGETGADTKKPDDKKKACRNDDLEVTVTLQPERDRASRGLVAVTNKGRSACTLEGRAYISLSNAAGETVDVPSEEVDEPGRAVAITLRPGRSAFEGIRWTTCDKGSSTCPAGNGLRFNVQGSTDGPSARLDGFPDPERSDITMKSLRIGTLQPVTQGVVAW